MTEKRWKRLERDVARSLSSRRIPVAEDGQARSVKGDIESPVLFVSVRSRARQDICAWFEEAAAGARRAGKVPLLVSRRPRSRRTLVVFDLGAIDQVITGLSYHRRVYTEQLGKVTDEMWKRFIGLEAP